MALPTIATLPAGHAYLMTMCECHHGRGVHHNGRGMCRGMCRGHHCHCGRFVKRTRRFVHLKMMEAALLGAIDIIESLPIQGATVKVGLPSRDESYLIIKQMKEAIAGPKVEA